MKKITKLLLLLSLTIFSCSSDDSITDNEDPTSNDNTQPQFAMTALINGVSFYANNPFGNNKYSQTNIWNYYPIEDFVMLQGRMGGLFGNPEINIWLKRTDIAVGSYTLGSETNSTPPSHYLDLIDNSNNESKRIVGGTISITEVNTTTKIVKGTFQFTTTDDLSTTPIVINKTVTNGVFRYQYEEVN